MRIQPQAPITTCTCMYTMYLRARYSGSHGNGEQHSRTQCGLSPLLQAAYTEGQRNALTSMNCSHTEWDERECETWQSTECYTTACASRLMEHISWNHTRIWEKQCTCTCEFHNSAGHCDDLPVRVKVAYVSEDGEH